MNTITFKYEGKKYEVDTDDTSGSITVRLPDGRIVDVFLAAKNTEVTVLPIYGLPAREI